MPRTEPRERRRPSTATRRPAIVSEARRSAGRERRTPVPHAVRWRHAGAALALTTAVLLALSACGDDQAPAAAATTTTEAAAATAAPRRQVRTVTPVSGTLSTDRSTSVTIEPAKQAEVASVATGRVADVLRREGAVVASGTVVLQLDDQAARAGAENARLALEMARVNLDKAVKASGEGALQAEAAVRTARANLDILRRQRDTSRQLFAAGGISANDLATLEAELSQAQAANLQAEDGLARAQRAGGEDLALLRVQVRQAENQVEQAARAVADAAVKAPFAGEIAELMVEEGEFVAAGSAVFRLASNDRQLARFQVPPADAGGLVQRGQVYVRYDGLDYAAHIMRTSELPGTSRQVEITAELYQASTRIPTGAIAQLSYTVDLATGLLLPSGSVQTDAGASSVLLVQDDTAVRRSVRVVAEAGGQVVVEGLPTDAEVIYPVPSDLRAGSPVAVTSGANAP